MKWVVSILTAGVASTALANDLEELAKDGYGAVLRTRVEDTFEGCEYDKRIPLSNGLIFVCRTYHYHYAYRPEVLIMKHVQNGDLKVVIDDDEYAGTLIRGR